MSARRDATHFTPPGACRGTIGAAFGPIMVIWFLVIAVMGVAQIVQMPSILACLSPSYAVDFFARNGTTGFVALGAVVLAVTGGSRARKMLHACLLLRQHCDHHVLARRKS